jgi:hypothetical protein
LVTVEVVTVEPAIGVVVVEASAPAVEAEGAFTADEEFIDDDEFIDDELIDDEDVAGEAAFELGEESPSGPVQLPVAV